MCWYPTAAKVNTKFCFTGKGIVRCGSEFLHPILLCSHSETWNSREGGKGMEKILWTKALHSKCISAAGYHRLLGIHCPRMPVSELECSPVRSPDFLSLWAASAHTLPVLQQWQEFHSTEKMKQVANKGRFTSKGPRHRCWNNKINSVAKKNKESPSWF